MAGTSLRRSSRKAGAVTDMNLIPLCALALVSAGAPAPGPASPAISLSQSPLVMRLSKDEFRIAFGIKAERCARSGCHGLIHYRVNWKADDGTTRSEVKQVSYAVAPRSGRSLTVDRQYFDTSEGEHTTEVTAVSVERISCIEGAPEHGL
jgi:hypothetical protein